MNAHDSAEWLSALADGELRPNETRFALRRLGAEVAAHERWERWHLVRAVLRREPLLWAGPDFSAAVMRAIARESVRPRAQRWLKPLIGAAIAAGVAAVALVVVSPRPAPERLAETARVPALSAPTGLTTGDFNTRLMPRPVAVTVLAPAPANAIEIERYFLAHSGQATGFARGGFVPYVNLVATPVAMQPVVAAPQGEPR